MSLFLGNIGAGCVTASPFSLSGLETNKDGPLDEWEGSYGQAKPRVTESEQDPVISDTCSVTSTGECRENVRVADTERVAEKPTQATEKQMFTPLQQKTGSANSFAGPRSEADANVSKAARGRDGAHNRSGAPTAPVPEPPEEDGETGNDPESSTLNVKNNNGGEFDTLTCATNDAVKSSVNAGFWKVCQLVLVIVVGVAGLLYVMHQRTRAYMATLMQELSDRNSISMADIDLGPLKSICKRADQPLAGVQPSST